MSPFPPTIPLCHASPSSAAFIQRRALPGHKAATAKLDPSMGMVDERGAEGHQ